MHANPASTRALDNHHSNTLLHFHKMADKLGVISRGIRAPVVKEGDDIKKIVVKALLDACEANAIRIQKRDTLCITESVVARAYGNYCTTDDIAADVRAKTGGKTVGLVFPILSRNRFSILLKGISQGCEKLIIQLSYPCDEVGNALFDADLLEDKHINPYTDTFTEAQFRVHFPHTIHPFTGVDYIEYFKQMCVCPCEIILSNNPAAVLQYTDTVINADIHSRHRTAEKLRKAGGKCILSLDHIMNAPINGSGYHEQFGLLGSNLAKENRVKLFPRDTYHLVEEIQAEILAQTGYEIEVMVYGDGAFKDPVGGIWELADPVVSPGFTKGLIGTPNEIKFKFVADTELACVSGAEAEKAMKNIIAHKNANLVGNILSQGTTPRRLTDLLGSLADLTSGSGDKGTPFILIQNYFKTYAE